jgi:hypothetical protein
VTIARAARRKAPSRAVGTAAAGRSEGPAVRPRSPAGGRRGPPPGDLEEPLCRWRWSAQDSNLRLPGYEPGALSTELAVVPTPSAFRTRSRNARHRSPGLPARPAHRRSRSWIGTVCEPSASSRPKTKKPSGRETRKAFRPAPFWNGGVLGFHCPRFMFMPEAASRLAGAGRIAMRPRPRRPAAGMETIEYLCAVLHGRSAAPSERAAENTRSVGSCQASFPVHVVPRRCRPFKRNT